MFLFMVLFMIWFMVDGVLHIVLLEHGGLPYIFHLVVNLDLILMSAPVPLELIWNWV